MGWRGFIYLRREAGRLAKSARDTHYIGNSTTSRNPFHNIRENSSKAKLKVTAATAKVKVTLATAKVTVSVGDACRIIVGSGDRIGSGWGGKGKRTTDSEEPEAIHLQQDGWRNGEDETDGEYVYISKE